MKKKLLLLSTIATLAFALCACDSKDSGESKSEPTTTEATTEATTENPNISEQVMEPTRGAVENGVYTNESIKVSFPIQDNWYVCSDAEVAQIIGYTTDNIEENTNLTVEQFEAATAGTVYDIVFYFSDMQSNVNITFMSLDRTGQYATLPVDDYAELSVTQLQAMTGVNYTIGDLTHETYGGDEYVCINAETDQGYNQKMLLKKENGQMVCITLTFLPELEAETQTFLDSFTEVQ